MKIIPLYKYNDKENSEILITPIEREEQESIYKYRL